MILLRLRRTFAERRSRSGCWQPALPGEPSEHSVAGNFGVTESSVPGGSVPGISSAPNLTVIAINTACYVLEPESRSGPGESDSHFGDGLRISVEGMTVAFDCRSQTNEGCCPEPEGCRVGASAAAAQHLSNDTAHGFDSV